MELTNYEQKLLRDLAGDDQGLRWGAAMSVSLEHLVSLGLISKGPNHELTEEGKKKAQDLIVHVYGAQCP